MADDAVQRVDGPADGEGPPGPGVLIPGETCTHLARADRVAFLIDGAAYFAAAKAAISKARRSVFLLGWDFDPRARLAPTLKGRRWEKFFGPFLNRLKAERPELDIRILIWKVAWPIAAANRFLPQRAGHWLSNGIQFRLDGTSPFGASLHEKLLVVDDRVAFCGGCDFSRDRLDIPSHPDFARWRVKPWGVPYPPRHDVMMMVEGSIARTLGDVARERWRLATGESLTGPPNEAAAPWPEDIRSDVANVDVGIARTLPAHNGRPAVRHSLALYLAAIHAAREIIYLENQYFTSPHIRDALAARLSEPGGPEVVMVGTYYSPSFFDRATMDSARDVFVRKLAEADTHDRFRIYAPRAPKRRVILMHSKLAIIDDRFVRIGSTNLNNRSFGYDTETDLAIETTGGPGDATAQAIARLRVDLIAHFLNVSPDEFEKARQGGSFIAAIEAMDTYARRRLVPYRPKRHGVVQRLVAHWHLGDPADPADAWRPWRRTP